MTTRDELVIDALGILSDLGLPKAQQNERSALSLLALLDMRPGRKWSHSTNPLIGITPIITVNLFSLR